MLCYAALLLVCDFCLPYEIEEARLPMVYVAHKCDNGRPWDEMSDILFFLKRFVLLFNLILPQSYYFLPNSCCSLRVYFFSFYPLHHL